MSSSRRFLLTVGALCGSGYLAAYVLAISPVYCHHIRNFADAAPCFKYDVRGITVDALLIGDSSLLYAIRPTLVEQQSGVSSYNYGMHGVAFGFDPQAVIDHYLATNARPRFVVMYFAPWIRIERYVISDPAWFPIALLALRHGAWIDFARLFRAQPSTLVEIPPTIFQSVGLSSTPAMKWRAEMESDGGHLNLPSASEPEHRVLMDQNCRNHPAANNRNAIIALREHNSSQGIPLYVYVAPTAACAGEISQIREAYAGVANNLPVTLPNEYFADDYAHVNADGVVVASNLFADFLSKRKLGSETGSPDP